MLQILRLLCVDHDAGKTFENFLERKHVRPLGLIRSDGVFYVPLPTSVRLSAERYAPIRSAAPKSCASERIYVPEPHRTKRRTTGCSYETRGTFRDRDVTRRKIDGPALPHFPIRTLAANVNGRGCGRNLRDGAREFLVKEALHGGGLRHVPSGFRGSFRDHTAAIVGGAHGTEMHISLIGLGQPAEQLNDLECLGTDGEDQKPFRCRIQRSQMPHMRFGKDTTHRGHDVVTCRTCWFVDEEKPMTHGAIENGKWKIENRYCAEFSIFHFQFSYLANE